MALCVALCLAELCWECDKEQKEDEERIQRQQLARARSAIITEDVGQGQAQARPNPRLNAEVWSGYSVNAEGKQLPMALWLNFDKHRCRFNGGPQESGHDFVIEEGWLQRTSVSFTKVVAGLQISYTGALEGERMSGTWFIPGYSQSGGSFLLEKK